MPHATLLWIGFNLFIAALLALDLGFLHRHPSQEGPGRALAWTAAWIALALLFNLVVWRVLGREAALQFLAGYLVEESLSMDNVFVFVTLFAFFKVPSEFQHRTLFYGLIGAVVFRAALILAGIHALDRFGWLLYLFGAFLVFTGGQMLWHKEQGGDLAENPAIRLFQRLLPVTRGFRGGHFITRENGRLKATPLLLALLVLEASDLVFALDSIPAVLALTRRPFIAYTSNIFAILGLRSLYFALAASVKLFVHLRYGLALILLFVGGKMLLARLFPIPTLAALAVIASLLAASIAASLMWPGERRAAPPS